ncbi:ABC transporter permease [Luteimicrobium xylanilyticum]|uniref:ABC transporter permease YtrF n=1 Tax=Luteimicrobium xylanilyticum TaxID=1133546 RepID=A0A5P9QED3_9MICO|nr:FtsX-like permease family protein [Luteimicrobium xylanilyticum]QFU99824.1 ABC transporter permease YtrF [Luteimicrobium xylanilyticum]
MNLRDVVADVLVEMSARRSRAVLMMVAVGLSVGALLCSFGISVTAAHQVDANLAADTVNVFTVSASSSAANAGSSGVPGPPESLFPGDAEVRVDSIAGVAASGRFLDVTGMIDSALSRPFDRRPRDIDSVTIAGIDPGYLGATNTTSTLADPRHLLSGSGHVVLLGTDLAKLLDVPVTHDPTDLTIAIGDTQFDVVGFVTGGSVDPSRTIFVPYTVALGWMRSDTRATMFVRTEPGAGAPVSRAAPLALRPDAPQSLRASVVVDASDARRGVATQLGRLAAGVGGLLLVLSILLIANSMVVAVMARTSEIGLRRAIGLSSGYVASLFLAEGGLAGLLGGLLGSAVSAVVLIGICMANGWTVVLPLVLLSAGPLLGVTTGVVSSMYPALRAARVDPATAVRAD